MSQQIVAQQQQPIQQQEEEGKPLFFNGDIHQGLLRFCIQHQDSGDLKNFSLPKRPTEDYEWLRSALSSMETDAQKMKRLIGVLREFSSTSTTNEETNKKLQIALEEIEYYVQDLDNALDFSKMTDSVSLLLKLLQHQDSQVRFWSCYVIQTCCQNNPKPTIEFVKDGTLNELLSLFVSEHDEVVSSKSLAAISAIIQNNSDLQKLFVDRGGISVVLSLISEARVVSHKIRATWLLRTLLQHSDRSKAKNVTSICIKLGAPKILMNNILRATEKLAMPIVEGMENSQNEWRDLREKTFQVLFQMSENSSQQMNEIFLKEKNQDQSIWFPALKDLYFQSMKKQQQNDDFENELVWIQKLFKIVYNTAK